MKISHISIPANPIHASEHSSVRDSASKARFAFSKAEAVSIIRTACFHFSAVPRTKNY